MLMGKTRYEKDNTGRYSPRDPERPSRSDFGLAKFKRYGFRSSNVGSRGGGSSDGNRQR